jgi:hypothetical protein
VTRLGAVGAVLLGLALSAPPAQAQDYARYRAYALGSSVSAVAALAEGTTSEARVIHERPALLQELEWRPSYLARGSASLDPIRQMVFSFYDDQLYRIVVDYDRERTRGMKDADIIQAVAVIYGAPSTTPMKNAPAPAQFVGEAGESIARWHDDAHSVILYRSPYTLQFRLIVTAGHLDRLARAAGERAVLQDQRDAPKRELAREKQARDEAQAALEKARAANKSAFRP